MARKKKTEESFKAAGSQNPAPELDRDFQKWRNALDKAFATEESAKQFMQRSIEGYWKRYEMGG